MINRPPVAAASVLVMLWPFVYLFRFVIPDQPFSLEINNDFEALYYNYKIYLLDCLTQQQRIPWWSPSEAGGFPFFSNPFTQTFYPLNIPLAVWYALAGGYSYHDHQLYTVLGLSIYSLGLLLWLLECSLPLRPAVVATMIVGVSFKLSELIRFPNAVHAAAWMPWLLLGLAKSTRANQCRQSAVIVAISILMLITAGYPYFAYYTLFLAGPYALLLLHPRSRTWLTGTSNPERLNSVPRMGVVFLAGVAIPAPICVPYVLAIRSLMSETTDRAGDSFAYSTAHVFSPMDIIGSLVFPPASQAEGWFYFGIIGLLIISIYLASFAWYRGHAAGEFQLAITLLAWGGLILLVVFENSSPLFKLLWHYFPGFSQLRVWGRMNIILLPLIALLLSRSYCFLEAQLFSDRDDMDDHGRRLINTVGISLVAGYFLVLTTQWCLYDGNIRDEYWMTFVSRQPGDERAFLAAGFVSFVILAVGILFSWRHVTPRNPQRPMHADRLGRFHRPTVFALLCVLVSALDMGRVGGKQWSNKPVLRPRQRVHVQSAMWHSFVTPRQHDMTTISLSPAYHVGVVENWYFKRYVDFHRRVFVAANGASWARAWRVNANEEPWFRTLMGMDDGRRLFFSESVQHATIKDFVIDANVAATIGNVSVMLFAYTGDELHLSVESSIPGYLSFVDNVDRDWKVMVNGERRELESLFGTFKSVRIPAGRSDVRFVYEPRYFRWLATINSQRPDRPNLGGCTRSRFLGGAKWRTLLGCVPRSGWHAEATP